MNAAPLYCRKPPGEPGGWAAGTMPRTEPAAVTTTASEALTESGEKRIKSFVGLSLVLYCRKPPDCSGGSWQAVSPAVTLPLFDRHFIQL